MPLYPYICEDCGMKYSLIHKYGETPDPCPKCESTNIKKEMTAPSIRMGGLKSMSTRHTTSDYYGPNPYGGAMKLKTEQYFPEEVKAKEKEFKKKQEGKGATVSVKKIPNKK